MPVSLLLAVVILLASQALAWWLVPVVARSLRRRNRIDQRARGLSEPPKHATPAELRRWYLHNEETAAILRNWRAANLPCVYPAPCDCAGCVRLGRDVPMVQREVRELSEAERGFDDAVARESDWWHEYDRKVR